MIVTRLARHLLGSRSVAARICAVVVLGTVSSSAPAQLLNQPTQQQTNLPQGSPLLGSGNATNYGNYNGNGTADQTATTNSNSDATNRLTPPVSDTLFGATQVTDDGLISQTRNRSLYLEPNPRLKPPPPPNEFEKFVERALGRPLPRFGADLLLPSNRDYAVPATATVPPGYILNVGDVVAIGMTGSIEGSVEREIDTNGRVFLPRVGWIRLGGIRYGDLKDTIARAIGVRFRNFTVNVGVRDLRGIRVYVTGFANNPGAYSVNSLSTMINAVLAAGGPSAGGSFRSVKLYRNNELVRDLDLYRLLLTGDRSSDTILQNEDVLVIEPLGAQAAVTGSVNTEAIYELRPGETLANVVGFAGGVNSLADTSRLLLYRLSNYDTIGVQQIDRQYVNATPATGGDIVQILSDGTLQRSVDRQSVLVRIEGEVNHPGSFYVPANTPLATALAQAGGLTGRAFVYGTRFERMSVQRQQREAFEEALKQLEVTLAAAPLTADRGLDAGERATQQSGARAVLDRLREAQPDGRVVLNLPPTAAALPGDLVLENGDRILVPPRPTTVGVFGAVYRPASFLLGDGKPMRVSDFVERAGGVIRSGDRSNIFVVRASGDVLSRRRGALSARVLPGDVIFVPVKTQSRSFWDKLREISTIVFQLGLSAATVSAISN